MPWKTSIRTIPLNDQQSPTPPPTADVVELRDDMRVMCHDGYIGKLEGVMISSAGIVGGLLVRIRGDILAVVQEMTEPLATLLPVANQRLLLPPAWIVAAKGRSGRRALRGSGGIVELDASAEQVRFGELVRTDAEISAEIYRFFDENPALAPYAGRMRITVVDGDVTLRGQVPSPRHRASAEQDVWHVAGVSSVRNDLEIGG